MNSTVTLQSDFVDFYDAEFMHSTTQQFSYIYDRMLSKSRHRTEDLNYLRKHGIPTLSLSPVSSFLLLEPNVKILVYTVPNKHNGKGKLVLDNREAQDLYPNLPGRIWIPHSETDGITLKCVQVGQRRFKVILQGDSDATDLLDKKTVSVEEIRGEYSNWNKNPIYSIDYIPTKNGLMATDYNYVENLGNLGIDQIMSSKDVYNEIINSFNHFY